MCSFVIFPFFCWLEYGYDGCISSNLFGPWDNSGKRSHLRTGTGSLSLWSLPPTQLLDLMNVKENHVSNLLNFHYYFSEPNSHYNEIQAKEMLRIESNESKIPRTQTKTSDFWTFPCRWSKFNSLAACPNLLLLCSSLSLLILN